jgi:N-acetylneuraminic acid mutarotase
MRFAVSILLFLALSLTSKSEAHPIASLNDGFLFSALNSGGASPDSIPNCNRWVTLSDTLAIQKFGAAVGVIEGKIYLASSDTTDDSSLEVYDPIAKTSTVLARMPTHRANVAGAVVNDLFYCIGGYTSSGSTIPKPSAVVEAYDPTTDIWTRKADLATPRIGASAAVLNGKIYVMGGGDSTGEFNSVEMYDPIKDKWTAQPPMLLARADASAVSGCGGIYIFGGAQSNLRECEQYLPGKKAWTRLTDLPHDSWEAQAVSGGENVAKLFLLGGYPGYLDSAYTLNTEFDTWSKFTSMLRGRAQHMAALVGMYIYVMGGKGSSGPTLSQIDRYSLTYIASFCNQHLCPGDSMVIQAFGSGATNFQWYQDTTLIPGATDSSYYVKQPGPYKATMTLATGCQDSAKFVVESSAPPTAITALGPTSFCQGDSVTLQAGPTGLVYSWFKDGNSLGIDTNVISVKQGGLYSLIGLDTLIGCAGVDSLFIDAKPNLSFQILGPNGCAREGGLDTITFWMNPASSIATNDSITFTLKYDSSTLAFSNFVSPCNSKVVYSDLKLGLVKLMVGPCVSGTTNPVGSIIFQSVVGSTLSPEVTLDSVSSTNSCLTAQSTGTVGICLTPYGCQLSTLNVTPFASSIISVNPNPAQDVVNIQYGLVDQVPVNIVIDDILGRPVLTLVNQVLKPGTYSLSFHTSGLATGTYYVHYLTQDARDSKQLQIKR